MGLFNRFLLKEKAVKRQTERNVLYLPIRGKVIEIEDIGDGVFSEGILGQGCGIIPSEEEVYAPAAGMVATIADTGHALGLTTEDGLDVLIHVGIDTVEMNGDGFRVHVKEGQRISFGQLLMTCNLDKIRAAGYSATTAFLITNSEEYKAVQLLAKGEMEKLVPVIKVES